jgi:hypothetical protein
MSDAMRRLPPSSLVKTVLLYERRLWREHRGLSGHLVGHSRDDVITWTADVSPSDSGPYALAVFTCGESARRLERLSRDERCGIVSDALADGLSIPAMRYPLGHGDVAWAQVESVAGGPGIPGPGVLTSLGRDLTRRRAGPLHFATAEVAKRWPGTPEGSVEAGRRAAYEALRALAAEDGAGCEVPAVAPWQEKPEESRQVPDSGAASRPQWQSYVPTPSQLVGMAAAVGMLALAVAFLKLYGTDSLLFKSLAI